MSHFHHPRHAMCWQHPDMARHLDDVWALLLDGLRACSPEGRATRGPRAAVPSAVVGGSLARAPRTSDR
jgi:hypothetical protein